MAKTQSCKRLCVAFSPPFAVTTMPPPLEAGAPLGRDGAAEGTSMGAENLGRDGAAEGTSMGAENLGLAVPFAPTTF